MATTPTNLPVPSETPRDLKFNAGKIDEFVTSLVHQYIDRFDNAHYTIEGLRWLAQQAIAQYGWIPVGTFQDGNTLTLPNQILKDETDGEYYRWDGILPKTVAAGSTPSTSGGIGVDAWISVGDSSLRYALSQKDGLKLIGGCDSISMLRSVSGTYAGQQIFLKSWHAGVNIGGGIFQWSSTSTHPDDSGCIIQPTGVTTGRWIRQGVVDKTPEMFGAIGDGVTDDTTALQMMADSANNSVTLAENFFGTFQMRNKYGVSDKISFGRPIKVDAYGARFVMLEPVTCFSFSMHNGLWEGGFFDYMGLDNIAVTEQCVAMELAPEINPIQVMNSSIRGIRVWGAHTGISFANDSTAVWMLELANHELMLRAGSSSKKACGIYFDSNGGEGGNTTLNIKKVAVGGKGNVGGAGLKGYFIKGVNEVSMYDISYDGYEFDPGVPRNVGEGDIVDVECFRCDIEGLHLEQIVNDVEAFSNGPININANSARVTGVENLLCSSEKGGAWISPTGNGVFILGTWHGLPMTGKNVGKIVDMSFWNVSHDPAAVINFTGNVLPSDLIGANTRHKVNFACTPSVFNIDSDVQVVSAGNILNLGFDRQAAVVSVIGERVGSSDLSFFAVLHCLRNSVGGWTFNMAPPAKSPNFSAAVINFGFTGNNLAFLISGDTNTYRIQCRIESDRAPLTSYF